MLIIWKILTSFYDKIEYARFEHEVKHPKWNRVRYLNPFVKNGLAYHYNFGEPTLIFRITRSNFSIHI